MNIHDEAESKEELGNSREAQLVVLRLGAESYAIPIEHVETVIVMQSITSIPRSANSIRGVINLRGNIIPVVDLRVRFGMPEVSEEDLSKRRIAIVRIEGILAGLIVDAVSEVLTLPAATIEDPSGLIAGEVSDCIVGIARATTPGGSLTRDRLILLLDIERVLGSCLDTPKASVERVA